MPVSPLSNCLLIIIILLTLGWTVTYIHYKDKYTAEQIAFRDYKEMSLKSEIAAREISVQTQKDLQERYNSEIERLENEKQNIHKLYASNRTELNSLYKTLNNNQSSLSTATTSATLNYTATLSNLLGECSAMVTEVSARADEATATAVTYHGLLVKNKEIVDSYNQTLQDSK